MDGKSMFQLELWPLLQTGVKQAGPGRLWRFAGENRQDNQHQQ
jgi:hypothetical protein